MASIRQKSDPTESKQYACQSIHHVRLRYLRPRNVKWFTHSGKKLPQARPAAAGARLARDLQMHPSVCLK